MRERIGLYLHERSATCVVVRGRGRVEHFTVGGDEGPAPLLRAALEARRARARGARLGLPRHLITVKVLELPAAARGSLEQMIAFELERHVPFPPDEMAFGFVEVPAARLGPRRVLVAACERRVVDGAVRALEGLRQRPQSLTVACHELPALLTRPVRARRAVWAHRHGATTSLLFLGRGQIRLSRSVQIRDAGELLAEVTATLPLLKWRDVEALWISGDEADSMLASEALAGAQHPVSEPPVLPLAEGFMRELSAEERGGGLLALGLALGSRRPALDLLPVGLRPTSLSVGQLVTVAMLAVTTMLGLGLLVAQDYRSERYLEDVSGAIKALDPEVKTVERMAGELAQKRRVLAALEGAEQRTLRPLTFLRDLTDALPPDVWLSALTMDTKGVELTGQAGAASQLIPLLEGSAWLERAEFISPVTKTRDKEQFRIRAAWEPDAGRRAGEPRLPQPGSPPPAQRPAGAPARPVTRGPGG